MATRHLQTILSVIILFSAGCSSTTANNSPAGTENLQAAQPTPSASQTPIPQYPPLYKVIWKICDPGISDKNAEGCNSNNTDPLRLWGPVGEAKLVKGTFPDLNNQPTVDRRLAIISRGCYPEYKQPSKEQLYSADRKVFIKKGSSPKIEMTIEQIDNKLVHSLLAGARTTSRSTSQIRTFSNGGCEPINK